jgi:hypothetical protein
MMGKWMLAAVPLLALALAAPAAAERRARCVITSRGSPTWRGACIFSPGAHGSFSISAAHGDMGGMGDLAIDVTAPGRGHAEYMMSSGRHEDWGDVRRSRRDPACWVGRDSSICVY